MQPQTATLPTRFSSPVFGKHDKMSTSRQSILTGLWLSLLADSGTKNSHLAHCLGWTQSTNRARLSVTTQGRTEATHLPRASNRYTWSGRVSHTGGSLGSSFGQTLTFPGLREETGTVCQLQGHHLGMATSPQRPQELGGAAQEAGG